MITRALPRWTVIVALAVTACGGDAKPTDDDIGVATLNVLHGLFCPGGTDFCRLPERMDLLFQWIEDSGCPDVVTLQEVARAVEPLLSMRSASVCGFDYHVVFQTENLFDDQLILSRWPALEFGIEPLLGGFRHVLWARVDHPRGPVDIFTTHLSSTSDNGAEICAAQCPASCLGRTRRECQAMQLAEFITVKHIGPEPALVTGDFNFSPDTFAYAQFVDRGWTDAYRAAGNPECDPGTGTGCTSGRQDQTLTDLESTAVHLDARIDFIFVAPAGEQPGCTGEIEAAGDPDGDLTTTGLFAGVPISGCGAAPLPICWVSDHSGVQVDVNCL